VCWTEILFRENVAPDPISEDFGGFRRISEACFFVQTVSLLKFDWISVNFFQKNNEQQKRESFYIIFKVRPGSLIFFSQKILKDLSDSPDFAKFATATQAVVLLNF